MDFKSLFKKAVDIGASDVHLLGGRKPMLRVHGSLTRVDVPPIPSEELLAQIAAMAPSHLRGALAADAAKGVDFSYVDPIAGRFRCSAFYALGQPGMTM